MQIQPELPGLSRTRPTISGAPAETVFPRRSVHITNVARLQSRRAASVHLKLALTGNEER